MSTSFGSEHFIFFDSAQWVADQLGMNLSLYKLLKEYMPDTVQWTFPSGGPNIGITLPPWLSAESLVFEAQKNNIAFLAGTTCYASEPEFNHIRLSFSSLDDE
ncbi:hypothetical protein [Anaerotignum sp.]|uniref:hypothetical protein n=1 Tax=Anaerotignum sp. TaxID=2039241 RepID=UPI0027153A03|nr:hypothetical protein [Anaerotignum sp.]